MCEFSEKLIAWLDCELPAAESAAVKRHLESCAECRNRAEAYQQVSDDVRGYCDAELTSSAAPRVSLPWIAAASAAGAAATLLALLMVWARLRAKPDEPPPVRQSVAAASSVVATESTPLPPVRSPEKSERRRAAASKTVRTQNQIARQKSAQGEAAAAYPANEPVIQIAIPAEEMFPPGAVPEGMRFVADVAIAADGSAERLRLRPRLAVFERSAIQP
jgi:anti-sigma factor RsiW